MLLAYGYASEILGREINEENRKNAESEAARKLLDRLLIKVGSHLTSADIIKEENEKPRFADGGIDFNITHSKGLVACALSLGQGRIGIDAERIHGSISPARQGALVRRFFSEKEKKALADGESFVSLWTKREAYLKMTGEGFAKGIGKDIPETAFFSCLSVDGYLITVASETEGMIEIVEI